MPQEIADATAAERLAAEVLNIFYFPETCRPWVAKTSEGLHGVLQEGNLERIALLMHNHRLHCKSKEFHWSRDGKFMERTVVLAQERREATMEKETAIYLAEVSFHLQGITRESKLDELQKTTVHEYAGHPVEFVAVPTVDA
jgi:hypothetical protein